MVKRKHTSHLTYAALCLALALALPFLTGQIPQIGSALCPMHIPVLLCGYLCPWPYALVVGFLAPLMRLVIFGMPPVTAAIPMAFELAAYGALTGVFYRVFPRRFPYIYASLAIAMAGGRLVWGAASLALAGVRGTSFPFSAFLAGAVLNALPGIVLHLVLIPLIVLALQKAKILRD